MKPFEVQGLLNFKKYFLSPLGERMKVRGYPMTNIGSFLWHPRP
jgi:hypothetical protein